MVIIKNDDDDDHHDDNDTDDDDHDDNDRIEINSLNNRAHISFHHYTNRPLIAFSDDEIRIFLPTCVTGRILFYCSG